MRSLVASVLGVWAGPAAAFCGTYVGSPGVELTNQTSQVIISRQDNTTTLTLANDYQGDATNFAMLIPVPEVLVEDDIQTVRPELFQRFNDYSAPRIVTYECSDFYWEDEMLNGGTDGGGMASEPDSSESEPPPVVVEGEYEVGIYEIVILSATDPGALIEWLDANDYGADPQAEEMLGEYIEDEQFFFAAKVNLSEVPEEGTFLEPLQFSYESDVFGLPVRLGTLNSPGEQDVVMYILTDSDDGQVGVSNYTEVKIEDECMVDVDAEGGADNYYGTQFGEAWAEEGTGEGWITEYAWATSWCDPCPTTPPSQEELQEAGFEGETWDSYFTRLRVRYTPEAADQDIMLYTSGISGTEQIRFIDYNIDMEDRYEVCGVGMVDDPGSCDDEAGSGSGSGSGFGDSESGSSGSGGMGGSNGGIDGGGDGTMSDGSGLSGSDGADDDEGGSKAGCSHLGGDGSGLGWSLFGLMALALRRRQSAG